MSNGLQIRQDASYTEEEMLQAFPDVDPGFEPFGSRVIVQLRCPKTQSKGGIILTSDSIETEMWNTQIAKVRAIGPVSFRNRTTLEAWPENNWCAVGDYVRIPKYNQDKWFIEVEGKPIEGFDGVQIPTKDLVLFMLVNDIDLLAKKIGNPLEVKAYI